MAEPGCQRSSSTSDLCLRSTAGSVLRVEMRVDAVSRDVHAVAQAQDRLLRVTEHISEELFRLGAAVDKAPCGRCKPGAGAAWPGAEEPCKSGSSAAELQRRLDRLEAALAELRTGCAEDSARHGAAIEELLQELRPPHLSEHSAQLDRHESELADLRLLREEDLAASRRSLEEWEPPQHLVERLQEQEASIAALQERPPLTHLEERLERQEAAIAALQDISFQLEHLQDLQREIVEVSRLDREAAAAPEARLVERLDRLEAELTDVQQVQSENSSRQEADVATRLATLETSLAELDRLHWDRISKQEADTSAQLGRLEAAVTAVQRSHLEKTSRQDTKVLWQLSRVESEQAEVAERLAKLQAEAAEAAARGPELGELRSRLEGLEERLGPPRQAPAEATEQGEEELEARLSSLEAAVAEAHHLLALKFAREEAEPLVQQVSQLQECLVEVQQLHGEASTKEVLAQQIANIEDLVSEVQSSSGEKISRHEANVSVQISRLRGELVEVQCAQAEIARRRETTQEQLGQVGAHLSRQDAELGALQLLSEKVECHEGAITDLQNRSLSAASTCPEAIMEQLEVWEAQLRGEFMAMHRHLVPELLAEVRQQLAPAVCDDREPVATMALGDEPRSRIGRQHAAVDMGEPPTPAPPARPCRPPRPCGAPRDGRGHAPRESRGDGG